ncbi:hypothetical protein [Marinomonas mediterranea]|uniref:hypothetical protein n=1 Tax=Marinomonas mediterranea TaxID=119864 RepID=UPI00234BCE54|nr:hypothetical protein [Marinomonas mediterranea]WCN09104.1 hypothetical protein GV055_09270 [Marinomonas mediterranea]
MKRSIPEENTKKNTEHWLPITQLPVPTAKPDDELKFQLLNNITQSMSFTEDSVVLPAIEVCNMVQAIRMYQHQIAQLKTPDWVNGSIERVKDCAGRHFCDV